MLAHNRKRSLWCCLCHQEVPSLLLGSNFLNSYLWWSQSLHSNSVLLFMRIIMCWCDIKSWIVMKFLSRFYSRFKTGFDDSIAKTHKKAHELISRSEQSVAFMCKSENQFFILRHWFLILGTLTTILELSLSVNNFRLWLHFWNCWQLFLTHWYNWSLGLLSKSVCALWGDVFFSEILYLNSKVTIAWCNNPGVSPHEFHP